MVVIVPYKLPAIKQYLCILLKRKPRLREASTCLVPSTSESLCCEPDTSKLKLISKTGPSLLIWTLGGATKPKLPGRIQRAGLISKVSYWTSFPHQLSPLSASLSLKSSLTGKGALVVGDPEKGSRPSSWKTELESFADESTLFNGS